MLRIYLTTKKQKTKKQKPIFFRRFNRTMQGEPREKQQQQNQHCLVASFRVLNVVECFIVGGSGAFQRTLMIIMTSINMPNTPPRALQSQSIHPPTQKAKGGGQ
jgi:hypothetical protein